jgi:hypothetical protein|tara:strand:- start:1040 stop:1918 length:879 start_codon:yes stop_codon:yes gene_type:complete
MKISNNFNLPQSFLDFARNDKYTKGDSDISVTTLIDSPRIRKMREHFANERSVDVVDMVWPLFGTAVHHILEGNKNKENVVAEERLYAEVDGWKLSGAIDQQTINGKNIEILDYKVTSVWSVIYGKKEWENQLNCYAYLVQRNKDKRVNKLTICAILRDWSRRDAERKPDYPQAPVVLVDVDLWSDTKRIEYVHERISAHQNADMMYDQENEFVLCNDNETWKREDSWAIKKRGQKRAMRVFDNKQSAIDFQKEQTVPVEMEYREGELTRCNGNFCGVAEFCSQYRERNRYE